MIAENVSCLFLGVFQLLERANRIGAAHDTGLIVLHGVKGETAEILGRWQELANTLQGSGRGQGDKDVL